MQEVVFFFGPPFGGKTSYYERHMKASHTSVSACELYQANPSWGLRHFVLHVLRILGEGKGVVIDDENWSRKTRQSCIQSIRTKVPACKFICHVFKPKDAFECLWRREWVLAEHFLLQETSQSFLKLDLAATEARIDTWFCHENGDHVSGLDAVEENEGWHQIKEIQTVLQPKTNYKFEVPAAFLDWGSIVDHSTDDLVEAVQTWKENTVCGRIIVIATITDAASNDKDSEDSNPGDIYKSVLKKIKAKTQILSRKLDLPVFYLIIKDQIQSGNFTKPPKPGILSFLQRLHHIDLHHPRTVYIYQSKGSRVTDFAQSGIKQFAAGFVCRNPNILADCQGGRASGSAHESIKDFDYITESDESVPSVVPFWNKIVSDDNGDDMEGSYLAEGRWGRVLGVSYRDRQTFRRFQEEYAANASHISVEGSKMGQRPLQSRIKRGGSSIPVKSIDPRSHQQDTTSDRAESRCTAKLPTWMMPKRRKNQDEVKDDEAEADKRYAGLPSTIYCMTVEELREVAHLFLDQDEESNGSSGSSPKSTKCEDSILTKDNVLEDEELEQSDEDVNLEMEERKSERERSTKELRCKMTPSDEEERNVYMEDGDDRDRRKKDDEVEDGGEDGGEDGVANIITDLFSGESRRKRPPPKKKAMRSPYTASSALLWSDEESPCQPNTTSTASKGNPQYEEEPKKNKPPMQDFSFLDEIF